MATAESVSPAVDLAAVNATLAYTSAEDRMAWAAREFGGTLVLSSNFGAQAAAMLRLPAQVIAGKPVVFRDTGHLLPKNNRFADERSAKLALDVRVYQPALTPAWLEARHGKLWEQGLHALARANGTGVAHQGADI